MRHHRVLNSEIVETRDFEGAAPTLAPNKGAWLPEVVEGEAYDAVSQVREGPVQTIEAGRVLVAYTVRTKSAEEVAEMRAAKLQAIKDEARRRILARYPEWKQLNMTKRAMQLVDIRHDRLLTEVEEFERQALIAASAWVDAVRTRSDELEAQVPADPAGIYAFDPLAGWDE